MIVGVIAMLAFACGSLLLVDDIAAEIDLIEHRGVKEVLEKVPADKLTPKNEKRLALAQAKISEHEAKRKEKQAKWRAASRESQYAVMLASATAMYQKYKRTRAEKMLDKDAAKKYGDLFDDSFVDEMLSQLKAVGQKRYENTRMKQDVEYEERKREKATKEELDALKAGHDKALADMLAKQERIEEVMRYDDKRDMVKKIEELMKEFSQV